MGKSENTGIRIIRFKDFCYEVYAQTPPFYFWEAHDDEETNVWDVITTTNPSSDITKWGNRYRCGGVSQGDGNWSILKSSTASNWADTTQTPSGKLNSRTYDVMMKAGSGAEIMFIFFWDSTYDTAYAIRLVGGGSLGLWKCSGTDITLETNWSQLGDDIIETTDADTDYYIKLTYTPEEITYDTLTIDTAGTFRVWVDEDVYERGIGATAVFDHTDLSSPLQTGDQLGLAFLCSSGVGYFDGIIFGDQYLPNMVGFRLTDMLILKGIAHIEARFLTQEDFPVEIDDRFEVWLNGFDENRTATRLCVFDGIIKLVDDRERDKLFIFHGWSEFWEWVKGGKREEMQSSYYNYGAYIRDYFIGEMSQIVEKTRIYATYIDSSIDGVSDEAISEDWTYDGTDYSLMKELMYLAATIVAWTPEGFFISNKQGFGPVAEIDLDQGDDGLENPQPIMWHYCYNDLIVYANKIRMYDKTATVKEANDTSHQTERGVSEERFFCKTMPATESQKYADQRLLQLKDLNPFFEFATFAYRMDLIPGSVINVTSTPDRLDSVPMMITDKVITWGDFGDESTRYEFPSGTVFFRAAYFDTAASPRRSPRIVFDGEEDTAEEVNKLKQQETSYGSMDHGGQGGLSDDDHTQYHNDTRGDARYNRRGQSLFAGIENVGNDNHTVADGDFTLRFDGLTTGRTITLDNVEDADHHGMIIVIVTGALNSYTLSISTTMNVQGGTSLTTDYKSYMFQYDHNISWWILIGSA